MQEYEQILANDRMPMKNETNNRLIVLQAIQSVLLSEELKV